MLIMLQLHTSTSKSLRALSVHDAGPALVVLLHPVLALHLRGDVDQKGGVRRERAEHRAPKVYVESKLMWRACVVVNLYPILLFCGECDWVCDSNLVSFFLHSPPILFVGFHDV